MVGTQAMAAVKGTSSRCEEEETETHIRAEAEEQDIRNNPQLRSHQPCQRCHSRRLHLE